MKVEDKIMIVSILLGYGLAVTVVVIIARLLGMI